MSYFVNSSSLERLFGLLFDRGGDRSSEPTPGAPRPFTAISISGSSSEESTSTNVLEAAIPAEEREPITNISSHPHQRWKYTLCWLFSAAYSIYLQLFSISGGPPIFPCLRMHYAVVTRDPL